MRKTVLCVLALTGSLLAACVTGNSAAESADEAAVERILVLGASGRSGSYLVRELKNQDRNFVGATSNIERAKEKTELDIEWVEVDVRNPESVRAAMAGTTHIISVLGATTFKGPNSPQYVDYEGVRNVVDAAVEAGIQQMVLISSSGVTQPDHPLNKLGNVMDWKLKGEDHLRASGLPYTIIRPGGLLDVDPGQNLIVFRQGDTLPYTSKLSVTGRGDLALMSIAALDVPAARNKTLEAYNDRQQPAQERDWAAMYGALQSDD